MPYSRLQYNGDSQYTIKDKRNLILTQETINKINNILPSGEMIDAVVETDGYSPMSRAQLKELGDAPEIILELNNAPYTYLYSLVDEEVVYFNDVSQELVIAENGVTWLDGDSNYIIFAMGIWSYDGGSVM